MYVMWCRLFLLNFFSNISSYRVRVTEINPEWSIYKDGSNRTSRKKRCKQARGNMTSVGVALPLSLLCMYTLYSDGCTSVTGVFIWGAGIYCSACHCSCYLCHGSWISPACQPAASGGSRIHISNLPRDRKRIKLQRASIDWLIRKYSCFTATYEDNEQSGVLLSMDLGESVETKSKRTNVYSLQHQIHLICMLQTVGGGILYYTPIDSVVLYYALICTLRLLHYNAHNKILTERHHYIQVRSSRRRGKRNVYP